MKWHYFVLLVGWAGPLIALQWVVGWRAFTSNLRAVLLPPLLATIFFTVCDSVAVRSGIWFFDGKQILGFKILGLPFEEVLFFLLTSLLVTQSLILLLPVSYRRV